jgi:hypothetical protein
MIRRKPTPESDGPSIDTPEDRWASLRRWADLLGAPCTPARDADDPVMIGRATILARMDRLEGYRLSVPKRLERLHDLLRDMPWPFPAGDRNRFGYATFLDSAEGPVALMKARAARRGNEKAAGRA